jgi:hypothetical protein
MAVAAAGWGVGCGGITGARVRDWDRAAGWGTCGRGEGVGGGVGGVDVDLRVLEHLQQCLKLMPQIEI